MATKTVNENKNIITGPPRQYNPDPRGVGVVLYECMLKNKDKLAQIYGPTGEKDTHDKLLQRSVRLAIAMKKHGIKPGDFVSNCTGNHLDSGTPMIASFFIGAIMAAVDPSFSVQDTIHLLKQAPPKMIFVTPEAVEMIEKVIEAIKSDTKIVVYGDSEKHTSFSDLLQPTEEEKTFKPVEIQNLEDTAIIFFTSGTTGFPKGVCFSHFVMACTVTGQASCDNSLTLAYAGPYWTLQISMICRSLISGTARLVYPKFEPDNVWHPFNYKITSVFFSAVHILTMLSQGRPKNLDISSITDMILGGSIVTLPQMIEIRKMFPETRVHLGYGQTEVISGILHFSPTTEKNLKFIAEKPASTGVPVPGITCKIVDTETERILGPNEEGELRVKTRLALSGYHNMDSSEIWDSEGFLKTGDVAYYDEDHCFYVVDRIKEMFKFQGFHVAPAIIEKVLLEHPAVEIAVVIGIPHEIDNAHAMGVVKLKASHQATAEEIVKYVEERVHDRQRLRKGVKFVDNFPTTASGKINRKKLRDMVRDGTI